MGSFTARLAVPEIVEVEPVTMPAAAATRNIIVGRVRASGTVVFEHLTPTRIPILPGVSIAGTLVHRVICFADHEIDAFEEVWIGGTEIPLESDGSVTDGHALANWIWVSKHLGSDSQAADSDMLAALPDHWGATDRLRGCAYLYVRQLVSKLKFPAEDLPNFTAIIRGAKPFDPRTHVSAYSANAALCLRWYLFNQRFGSKLTPLYSTGTVTVTNLSAAVVGAGTSWLANIKVGMRFDVVGDGTWVRIAAVASDTSLTLDVVYGGSTGSGKSYAVSPEMDEASVVKAADVSDESVALAAGGNENRYAVGGVISLKLTPQRIIDDLTAAMAGDCYPAGGGGWTMFAGEYVAPTVTLTDADMVRPAKLIARRSQPQIFNRVKSVFVSPDHRWQKMPSPAVTSSAYETEDLGEVIETTKWYPLTTSFATVQRLMTHSLEEVRRQESVDLLCTMAAYLIRPGENFSYTNSRPGWSAKQFRALSVAIVTVEGGDGPFRAIHIIARATDSAEWSWSAAENALDPLPSVVLSPTFTEVLRKKQKEVDLRVSGLELDNGLDGNSTEFTGPAPTWIWRDRADVESFELGGEPGGAGAGVNDVTFRDWEVTIKDLLGSIRRIVYVQTPAYTYDLINNRQDGSDRVPIRVPTIEVRARDTSGRVTKYPATMKVINSAPALPVGILVEGGPAKIIIKDVVIDPTIGLDPDIVGLAVWTSLSSGFTPDETNLVYAGAPSNIEIEAAPDTEVYIRYAIFDAFGLTGLNFADEFSVKTSLQIDVSDTSVEWDLAKNPWIKIDLRDFSGDCTLTAINFRSGTYFLTVIEDGADNILYDSGDFQFSDGGASPDHSAGSSGDKDIISFICDGVTLDGVAQIDFKAAT